MLDDSARKSMNKSAIDLNQSESKLSIGDKTSPPLTKDGDGDLIFLKFTQFMSVNVL